MEFNINTLSSDTRPAGVRALHYLADLLRGAGHLVQTINGYGQPPPYNPDGIAVYPDMIPDNPFKAKRVVRYFFYYPDVYFGTRVVPASELAFCWNRKYYDSVQALYEGQLPPPLAIPVIEPELFFPEDKTIPQLLYVGNKGHMEYKPILPKAKVVTRDSHTRTEFAALLRKTDKFYSTDYDSMALVEAKLCGCKTFIPLGVLTFHEVNHSADGLVMDAGKDIALANHFVELVKQFFQL